MFKLGSGLRPDFCWLVHGINGDNKKGFKQFSRLVDAAYKSSWWLLTDYDVPYSVPKKSPPRVFGHNSWPRALVGTRIGGNGSYQPPGALWTLQDPEKKLKTLVLEPDFLQNKSETNTSNFLLKREFPISPFWGHLGCEAAHVKGLSV